MILIRAYMIIIVDQVVVFRSHLSLGCGIPIRCHSDTFRKQVNFTWTGFTKYFTVHFS